MQQVHGRVHAHPQGDGNGHQGQEGQRFAGPAQDPQHPDLAGRQGHHGQEQEPEPAPERGHHHQHRRQGQQDDLAQGLAGHRLDGPEQRPGAHHARPGILDPALDALLGRVAQAQRQGEGLRRPLRRGLGPGCGIEQVPFGPLGQGPHRRHQRLQGHGRGQRVAGAGAQGGQGLLQRHRIQADPAGLVQHPAVPGVRGQQAPQVRIHVLPDGHGQPLLTQGHHHLVPQGRQVVRIVQGDLHRQRLQPGAQGVAQGLLQRQGGIALLPEPAQILFPGEVPGAQQGQQDHPQRQGRLPSGHRPDRFRLRSGRESAGAPVQGQQQSGQDQETGRHACQQAEPGGEAQIPEARKGRHGAGQEGRGGGQAAGHHPRTGAEQGRPDGSGLAPPGLAFVPVAAEQQDPHIIADAQQHRPEGRRHEVQPAQDPSGEPQGPEHAQQQGHHHEAVAGQGAETDPVHQSDEHETQGQAHEDLPGEPVGFPVGDGMGPGGLQGEGPPGPGRQRPLHLGVGSPGRQRPGAAPAKPGQHPGRGLAVAAGEVQHHRQQHEPAVPGLQVAGAQLQGKGPHRVHGPDHGLVPAGEQRQQAQGIQLGPLGLGRIRGGQGPGGPGQAPVQFGGILERRQPIPQQHGRQGVGLFGHQAPHRAVAFQEAARRQQGRPQGGPHGLGHRDRRRDPAIVIHAVEGHPGVGEQVLHQPLGPGLPGLQIALAALRGQPEQLLLAHARLDAGPHHRIIGGQQAHEIQPALHPEHPQAQHQGQRGQGQGQPGGSPQVQTQEGPEHTVH